MQSSELGFSVYTSSSYYQSHVRQEWLQTLVRRTVVAVELDPWTGSSSLWGQSGDSCSLLALLLANQVTLGKSLHISGPPFSYFQTKAWDFVVSKAPASSIPDKVCVWVVVLSPQTQYQTHPYPY